MRYVIAICLLTGFLLWDGVYHGGAHLDMAVREVGRVLTAIGI